jgi:hypothetical protein
VPTVRIFDPTRIPTLGLYVTDEKITEKSYKTSWRCAILVLFPSLPPKSLMISGRSLWI